MSENNDRSGSVLGECETVEKTSEEVAVLAIPQPQPIINLPESYEITTNMDELIKWAENRKELILSNWKGLEGKEITNEMATEMSKDAEEEISKVKSTISRIAEMRTESLRPVKESVKSVEQDVAKVLECFNSVITTLNPIVSKAKDIAKAQRADKLKEAFVKVAELQDLREENRAGFSIPDSILNKKTLTSKEAKEFIETFVADLLKIQKENDEKVEFAKFACKGQTEILGLAVPLDYNDLGSLKLLTTVEIAAMINSRAKKQQEVEQAAKTIATTPVVEVETTKGSGNYEPCPPSMPDAADVKQPIVDNVCPDKFEPAKVHMPPVPEGELRSVVVKLEYYASQIDWLNDTFKTFSEFGISVKKEK